MAGRTGIYFRKILFYWLFCSSLADRAVVTPINGINGLGWKPGRGPSIESHGFFPGLETRYGPPENETGAPIDQIGSAGKDKLEGGDRSEGQDYLTSRLTATAFPRIIALHWGLSSEVAHA